jgi:putative membrane protein
MRFGVVVAALIGFAVTIYLILHIGVASILGSIENVGWPGFAIICGYALLLECVLGGGWFALLPDTMRGRYLTFLIGRQVRDSAGDVLPFSQIGGIVVGARAVILRNVPTPLAFASMIADVTTELMAQVVFIAIGAALCIARLRAAHSPLANALLIGIALMVPGVGAFVVLQQRGSALANSLAGRFVPSAVKHAAAFNAALGEIYEARWRLAASAATHLAGWLMSGIGVWITMRLIGGRIDLFSAIAIEALLAGLRSATVFVPASIGVQEAGYATLAPLFGLPPEVGLAASLLKRARELTIGVPVLIAWQAAEGRQALLRDNPAGKP